MYIGLHVKYPLFLSDFNRASIFLTDFRKILKYQISQNSVQWAGCFSMRTKGRTDMTKLTVFFRQFWEGVLKTRVENGASRWNWPIHFPADFSSTFYHNLFSIVTTLLRGLWGIGIPFLAGDVFLLLTVAPTPVLDLQEPPNQRNARRGFDLSPSI